MSGPTINYFGRFPTTIVFRSSADFNGAQQSGTPEVGPGMFIFPSQAGGGLFNFHKQPIEVKAVSFSGGGALTITKKTHNKAGDEIQAAIVGVIAADAATKYLEFSGLLLNPTDTLVFSSVGSTTPTVAITAHEAAYAADGAC